MVGFANGATGHVPDRTFIAVMNSLLNGADSHLRCGSGIDFFTIMPDGRISACRYLLILIFLSLAHI